MKDERGDAGDNGCPCGSSDRATEADGSIGSHGNATERGEHARLAAQNLAELGGKRIGRGFGERGDGGDEGNSTRINANHTCQALSGIPAITATPRLAATCEAVRPRFPSALPSLSLRLRPKRVAAKVSRKSASRGQSAVRQPGVQTYRLTVKRPPVNAAAGVAARRIQT